MISLYGSDPASAERGRDDPLLIGFIEGCIDNIADHAEELYGLYYDDDGDDGEGQDDDDWDEEERLEALEDLLGEHVRRVCDDISDAVWDPDNTVLMFQRLLCAVDGCIPLEEEVRGRMRSFAPAVRMASADALLGCYLMDGPGAWVDGYMNSVPEDVLQSLVGMMDASGVPHRSCRGTLFAAGRYEDYVRSRGSDERSLLEVSDILASSGRAKEARVFADMLPRPSESPARWRDIAAVYGRIGDADTAAEYALPPFLESPSDDLMGFVLRSTQRYIEDDLVGMAEEAAETRPSSDRLSFLAEHGRAASVSRILDGMGPEDLAGMYTGRLFGTLMARGQGRQAVRMARSCVLGILDARAAREYGRAADALLALDSAPPGMAVDGEDADGFRERLRREHGRLTRFWSVYREEGGAVRSGPRDWDRRMSGGTARDIDGRSHVYKG